MNKKYGASARLSTDQEFKDFCEYTSSILPDDSILYEIGSYMGHSAIIFNEYFKNVYCVDAWISGYDPNDGASNKDMRWVENEFDNRVKSTDIIKCKGLSIDIAKTVEDDSIDIVYIDATHTYEGVKSDILAWIPKVKSGGIISGHDYDTKSEGWDNGGLKRAIHETLGIPEKIFWTNWLVTKR